MAEAIYQRYYQPRICRGASEQIQLLKKQGYQEVLVTSSLDFLMEPLAQQLGADFTYATQLVEHEGRFTGQIKGTGASSGGKGQCMQSYAKQHQLCLSSCLAFGDSIADLCMLEKVGMPFVVNPDRQLESIAASRGRPVLFWKLEGVKPAMHTIIMECIASVLSKIKLLEAGWTLSSSISKIGLSQL